MPVSDLKPQNSLVATNLRVTHENPTHGVPAFQIEMANMASPAGRIPGSSITCPFIAGYSGDAFAFCRNKKSDRIVKRMVLLHW